MFGIRFRCRVRDDKLGSLWTPRLFRLRGRRSSSTFSSYSSRSCYPARRVPRTLRASQGTWLIYNGTLRFTEQWSIFTEAQLRAWEVVSNLQEWLVRASGQYHFTPNAMVGFGYLYTESYAFEGSSREKRENRVFAQLGLWQRWGRAHFEHRYRVEQRWLSQLSPDLSFAERTMCKLSARRGRAVEVTIPRPTTSTDSPALLVPEMRLPLETGARASSRLAAAIDRGSSTRLERRHDRPFRIAAEPWKAPSETDWGSK